MQEIVSLVGLTVIFAAWAMQLTLVLQNRRELSRNFIAIYTIGVVILTIAGANRGLDFMAVLNIGSAILAVLIFLKLPK